MKNGFFVTGTDTGVGKTTIAAAIIRTALQKGLRSVGMKPVETGCRREGDTLIPEDGTVLWHAADRVVALDDVVPVRFAKPVAPLVAERLEGHTVDLARIHKMLDRLNEEFDTVVVEGAGGLFVPITDSSPRRPYFMLDLARDIGFPLIIVARAGLGTLNHTLLSVKAAVNSGVDVAAVIVNQGEGHTDVSGETNLAMLRELLHVPVLGVFPRLRNFSSDEVESASALINICRLF